MLKLSPYQSVGELHFGDSHEKANEVFGDCLYEKKNRGGELEKHYKDFTLCFTPDALRFRECTVHRNVAVALEGRVVDWSLDGLLSLCREDESPMEYHGTIILFSMGVALTGLEEGADSDRALTVFARGDWDALKGKMKSFNINDNQ
jgi:hypothetical protein